ncbi:Guanosine-5'-triphosphate,3'-diphosphate pyrophosphatase [Alphaproteobacteria bacterium SO-S41]|nr:Guanosine-5'-triphosphate,3'-diphosphate pyrophosphatase [Alphaproteobacteria bacterium SO-S41]
MFGVIDIGSNSVRLVVFEAAVRNPVTLFNEKAICAIGRNMVSTGRLDADGMKLALAALKRFRVVADSMGVKRVDVVATAAARDARNGPDFVRRASEACGRPVKVLTGEQEAELAALGVISGLPDADGLVGDLGGGSLELTVVKDSALGAGATLPFGPLRLIDAARGRLDRARAIVDDGIMALPGLEKLKGRSLYAVGGVWRNIARLHMARTGYPLHILHGYEMSRAEILRMTEFVMTQSQKTLERMIDVPRRRAESLPFGALVLDRLVRLAQLDRVIVSAFGVREGVLFKSLPAKKRALDPLYETADDTAERFGRRRAQADEIETFTAPLFEGEKPEEARLRRAACLLSDSAWRQHPDYRAELSFRYVLQAQIAGIRHRARGFLALTLWHRYGGQAQDQLISPIERLVGLDTALRAERLGRALRLGYVLAGTAGGIGKEFSMRLAPDALILRIARSHADVRGEAVDKRLEDLATSFVREPRIQLTR